MFFEPETGVGTLRITAIRAEGSCCQGKGEDNRETASRAYGVSDRRRLRKLMPQRGSDADSTVPQSPGFGTDLWAPIPASEIKQESGNHEDGARQSGERGQRKRRVALSGSFDGDVARSVGEEGPG
jgi:hypothetical protein